VLERLFHKFRLSPGVKTPTVPSVDDSARAKQRKKEEDFVRQVLAENSPERRTQEFITFANQAIDCYSLPYSEAYPLRRVACGLCNIGRFKGVLETKIPHREELVFVPNQSFSLLAIDTDETGQIVDTLIISPDKDKEIQKQDRHSNRWMLRLRWAAEEFNRRAQRVTEAIDEHTDV
jgi:hypothetical protein